MRLFCRHTSLLITRIAQAMLVLCALSADKIARLKPTTYFLAITLQPLDNIDVNHRKIPQTSTNFRYYLYILCSVE